MEAAFIDAIVENPDDEGRWMVYADWLLQQNDPRGELINLELAAERRAEDETLKRRIGQITRDEFKLLSPRLFAMRHAWTFEWWRGFIRTAHPLPKEAPDAFGALFADPHAGLLASLGVLGDEQATAPVFAAPRRHLRKLTVTELGRFADGLNEIMPNLEELIVTGGVMAHGGVPLAGISMLAHGNLRTFVADQYSCPAATTAALIVPRLETLQWTVMPGDDIAGEGSIVHRPPPGLRRLILDPLMQPGTDATDAAANIAKSALVQQLAALQFGDLGVAALEALCTLAPQLAHLEELRFEVPFTFIGGNEPPVHVEYLAEIERRLVAAMPHTKIEYPRESRVEPAQI